MDTKQEDGKGCCTTKCCGKAACAIVLLLVGGIGGYFVGRKCQRSCDLKAAAEVSAPATTTAPAAKPAK